MIRRHASTLRALLMLGDALAALVVLAVVAHVRFGPDWDIGLPEELARPGWAILYAAVWVLLLYLEGQYRLRARWTLRSEAVGIVRAGVWFGLLTTSALFLAHAGEVSRLYVVLLFPTQVAVTIVMRATLRWTLSWMRRHGRNVRNILILGDGPRAREFAAQVEVHSALGLHVIGFLGEGDGLESVRWRLMGQLADLKEVLHAYVVDEVAICVSSLDWATVEAITQLCQDEGKIVRVPLDLPRFGSGRRFVEDFDGATVLSVANGPDHDLMLAAKRLFDLVGASVALVLLSPVMLGVAIWMRVREGGPIIFGRPGSGSTDDRSPSTSSARWCPTRRRDTRRLRPSATLAGRHSR